MLILTYHVSAQSKVTFKFKTEFPVDTVTFFNFSQTNFIKSKFDNELYLETDARQADYYNLYFKSGDKLFKKQFWLDAGTVTIIGNVKKDGVSIDSVIGSSTYYKSIAFFKLLAEIKRSEDSLLLFKYILNEFEQQKNNPFCLEIAEIYVDHIHNDQASLILFLERLNSLSQQVNQHFFYKSLIKRIKALLRTSHINLSRFSFYDKQNEKVIFKETHFDSAKFIILDFWFTGCAPCISQHEYMLRYYSQLTDNGISILGISSDESFAKWAKYLDKNIYPWMNVWASGPQNIISSLEVHIYPTYMILDSSGKILSSYYSFDQVLQALKIQ